MIRYTKRMAHHTSTDLVRSSYDHEVRNSSLLKRAGSDDTCDTSSQDEHLSMVSRWCVNWKRVGQREGQEESEKIEQGSVHEKQRRGAWVPWVGRMLKYIHYYERPVSWVSDEEINEIRNPNTLIQKETHYSRKEAKVPCQLEGS